MLYKREGRSMATQEERLGTMEYGLKQSKTETIVEDHPPQQNTISEYF